MALTPSDKTLIDELTNDLRTRFQVEARMDGVNEEEINGQRLNVQSNSASAPVMVTKDDLRANSGRRVVRDAYLQEFAAELGQKSGIEARADLSLGVVIAHAVPDTAYVNQPMTIAQLKAQAKTAANTLRSDDEDN